MFFNHFGYFLKNMLLYIHKPKSVNMKIKNFDGQELAAIVRASGTKHIVTYMPAEQITDEYVNADESGYFGERSCQTEDMKKAQIAYLSDSLIEHASKTMPEKEASELHAELLKIRSYLEMPNAVVDDDTWGYARSIVENMMGHSDKNEMWKDLEYVFIAMSNKIKNAMAANEFYSLPASIAPQCSVMDYVYARQIFERLKGEYKKAEFFINHHYNSRFNTTKAHSVERPTDSYTTMPVHKDLNIKQYQTELLEMHDTLAQLTKTIESSRNNTATIMALRELAEEVQVADLKLAGIESQKTIQLNSSENAIEMEEQLSMSA